MTRAGFPPWTLSKALDVSVNRSISSPQEHYVCGLECHLGLLIDLQHSYPAIPIHSLKYFSQLKSRALSNGDFFLAPSKALLLASWEFQFRKRSFHSVIHASDIHGSELFTPKTYTVWKLVRESMLGWEDEATETVKTPLRTGTPAQLQLAQPGVGAGGGKSGNQAGKCEHHMSLIACYLTLLI